MIAIIDAGLGNIKSVQNMIERVGHASQQISRPEDLDTAQKIILPGVGSFDSGIKALQDKRLVEILEKKALLEKIPILGICLGAQLMTRGSEEGCTPGLAWLDADVVKFERQVAGRNLRLPHVGWSRVRVNKANSIIRDLPPKPKYYFLHSYHIRTGPKAEILLESHYGSWFNAAIRQDNLTAIQFHPEKSHQYGMAIFRNFLNS